MNEMPKVSKEAFIEAMAQETRHALEQVMQAVNNAPTGAWINASEWKVHEVMGELRRVAHEKALQMRTEAAEGAFSPAGASPEQGTGTAQQPERQRMDDSCAKTVEQTCRQQSCRR
jgi:hypothetical protein